MRKILLPMLCLILLLSACGNAPMQTQSATEPATENTKPAAEPLLVNGNVCTADPNAAVYVANDIIYYESGKDHTYGEGTEDDAHTAEEAAAHTVVHITQPGTYRLSGTLELGQIFVDLGEDAKDDPGAVVTLILDGVDITCTVAPAVIFYNVYECAESEAPTKDVDTSAAGANVILADGSENTVNGSYVARIYKPGSITLSEDGKTVEDAKKLHKYDGAFYSKMSMNISGETDNTGRLHIYAENEGLGSEMHLTLNSGQIFIESGNDGINTNEDGVSVTTVNAGMVSIRVTGETGEGDGIDSNGWLVIRGGTVMAYACSDSADAGIDSDMGIHIDGGTVIATGSMLDRVEDGGQTYAVFNFAGKQSGGDCVVLKDEGGNVLLDTCPPNAYSVLIYSSPELQEGAYTLWSNGRQLINRGGGGTTMPGRPDGGARPPEGAQPPAEMMRPDMPQPPAGEHPVNRPDRPGDWQPAGMPGGEATTQFPIVSGANYFSNVSPDDSSS